MSTPLDADPGAQNPVPRVGARLLLRDPAGAVLLIHEHYVDSAGHPAIHWLTPGGGVEADESLVQAAEREAFEETGLRLNLPATATPVHQTRRRWNSATTVFEQDDYFFLVDVPERFEVKPGDPTPEEVSTLIETRWWSVAELLATAERILPPDLGRVLRDLASTAATSE